MSDELKDGPGSQADRLVGLVLLRAELFHDQLQTPYARISVDGSFQNLRCRSRAFRRWMARLLYEVEEKAPSTETLSSALNVAEARAIFDGECYRLHCRVAHHENAIWYDLTDEQWRAVRVTSDGWHIIDHPPILFTRYEHQAPQIEPIKGGDVNRLFDFIAVTDDSSRLLMKTWLVSCFVPDIPHPVPVLHGSQGSGKSSTFRVLRRLIDPSAVDILSFPRDGNELVQMLSHHWSPLFDNVSGLQGWQSDILCRAVTGEGLSKRTLYSDDEDFIYTFRRCVGLNGINVAATRPDLLDRSILIALDWIPPERRRTEADLWTTFAEARPHILGGIFDGLSKAIRLLPKVRLSRLPRMADFARWGCAIAQALGHKADDFLQAYEKNIAQQNEEVLESHSVAAAMLALMEKQVTWEGTPSELLAELTRVAEARKIDIQTKVWPRAAHALMRRLKEVQPNLQDVGITFSIRHSGHRVVSVKRDPWKTSSGASRASVVKWTGHGRC